LSSKQKQWLTESHAASVQQVDSLKAADTDKQQNVITIEKEARREVK